MQEKTEQTLTFVSRVEKLKLANGWTWQEVARRLGISRTMIHFIKTGKHQVTQKNWRRLEAAERGVDNQQFGQDPSLSKILGVAEEESKVKITLKDIDRRYVDVPLQYRRGAPPQKYPSKIRVIAPDARAAAQALVAIRIDEDFNVLLSVCLPKEFATTELFDTLTPFSYNALVDAALTMTFGLEWQRMIGK